MPAFSVMIITKNEEANIGNLIETLRNWEVEILVIDSGSTDNTVRIAENLGAKVLFKAFEGYGAQKQYGTDQVSHDWVFSIDADELPDSILCQNMKNFALEKQVDERIAAYQLARSLVFLGKPMQYTREYKQPLIRLFDRRKACFSQSLIHEQIIIKQGYQTSRLAGQLWHFSYTNLSHYLKKFDEYTSKWAQQAGANNKNVAIWQIYLRFPIEFVKVYFLYRFVFNGWRGLVWALGSAFYPVVKYAKVKEKK